MLEMPIEYLDHVLDSVRRNMSGRCSEGRRGSRGWIRGHSRRGGRRGSCRRHREMSRAEQEVQEKCTWYFVLELLSNLIRYSPKALADPPPQRPRTYEFLCPKR